MRKGIAPGKEYNLPSGEDAMARSLKVDYKKILTDKEAIIKKFTDIMMAK